MGFLILEQAEEPGLFLAVNAAQVKEVLLTNNPEEEYPVCLLKFKVAITGFQPLVFGMKEDIESLVEAAKRIEMNDANFNVITNNKLQKDVSMVLKQSERIILVRELSPDDFPEGNDEATTASRIYMDDFSTRYIVERPGIFAGHVNENGNVPALAEE